MDLLCGFPTCSAARPGAVSPGPGARPGRFVLVGGASRVDFARPCVDTPREVQDALEAVMRQEHRDLHAAHAVMADADDRPPRIEAVELGGNSLHRDMDAGGQMTALELPVLADVEKLDRLGAGVLLQAG